MAAAPVRILVASPSTQKPVPRAPGLSQPEEVFSRDGPLGAKADVRVITSDGRELWLHRVVLEMWSNLFHDLIAAHEEELEPVCSSSQYVTITLTDSAADLMLLLSCLYPASHHADRKQGSALDAASLLPLLGLADKYHCPHIIGRCAAFATDHVLPRLAAAPCACAATAAEYLQLQKQQQQAGWGHLAAGPGAAATGVQEWVVRCLELAVRLDLEELAESTAALLGRRFFDWGLQEPAHGELMARAARILPADKFVRLVLQSIPHLASAAPSPGTVGGTSGGKTTGAAAALGPARNGGMGAGAAGGGGGPRIVPVMVAAAGPAAVAMHNQQPLPPPPQQQPPLPLAGWPAQPMNQAPFVNGAWLAPAGNGQAFAQFGPGAGAGGGGGGGGLGNQPEPLLGPGHGGW